MTFANNQDFISFRHHVYTKKGKEVNLAEVGPRFEMKCKGLGKGGERERECVCVCVRERE